MKEDIPFNMLFANKTFIQPQDIRRIILASVFVSDHIFLPANIHLDPTLNPIEKKYVTSRLHELRDIQALKFWEIEGNPYKLTQVSKKNAIRFKPSQVIPHNQYNTIMSQIDSRLMEQRQMFLGEHATSYDGITEMTLGKQTLWRFAIARALDADRLVLDKNTQGTLNHFFSDLMKYQEFESQIIEKIADKLNLPDVSYLSVEQIEECRKLMPAFRKKLLEKSINQYDSVQLMAMVEEIANSIVDEFLDLIISKSQDTNVVKIFGKTLLQPTGIGKEVTWDLLQLLFAPIIAVKYAGLFFDWAHSTKTSVPLLLLLRLRQYK